MYAIIHALKESNDNPMHINLPNFSNAHVLVIGDIMLDQYWHGGTHRISPEAPVPVVQVTEIDERPGGAGNVALNIAALGAKVTLISLSGDDSNADILENKLQAAGINCHLVRVKNKPTITKLRVLSLHQQLIRLDFEELFESHEVAELNALCEQYIPQAQAIILSDYGKGTLNNCSAFIAKANACAIPILVDPKGRDFSIYRGATLLTPNRKEFEEVVGACHDEQTLINKAQDLIQQYQFHSLLVTRGSQGMTLFQPGKNEFHLPAIAREVYDVTGAGDTVISVFASAIAAGSDFETATLLANRAAGLVVGKLGAATVSVPELRRAIQADSAIGTGVMSQEQLAIMVADAKAHGEKIVMTNGCFDILHAGHVSYLEKAKALGDRLIVAVNDDLSVKKLKGDDRPINNLDRRMAVIAGLNSVDWVVPFSEDTPARLIAEILPNVLVKGGDYQVNEIAGAEDVINNGGDVKVLNFEQGCSTSAIVAKIKQKELS